VPREIDRFVKGSRGKVQVIFKHFPLCKDCNPSLAENHHPLACGAACAAEAARRQGKFWDFHDALFAADLNSEQVSLEGIARQSALDLARFDADRHRNETLAKVMDDVELGIRLGVVETPTIFVNGRRAPDVRAQSLHMLITSEIANQTRVLVAAKRSDKMLTAGEWRR
jgi:protein-disulfide isomerase